MQPKICLINLGPPNLMTSNQALMVSLTIRDLGVPCNPYAAISPIVLHLPAGFIPEHASASLSSSKMLESDIPDA